MSAEDTIQRGIQAAQAGDHVTAKTLLSKGVLQDPNSEQAWWWLGLILENPEQRAYCFRKVLQLNPENLEAQAQLMRAERAPAPSPPAPPESPSAHIPPFYETELERDLEDDELWEQPELKSTRRRSAQQAILAVLIVAVLCVAVGGGAYIFIDTTGLLTLAAPPIATATSLSEPEITEDINTPALPPTWTPTRTPSLQPTEELPTDTPEATPSPPPAESTKPPTPTEYPDPADAVPVLLYDGTGPLSLDPNGLKVFKFQPTLSFQIRSIAFLMFNLIGEQVEGPPTILLLLWNPSDGEWSTVPTRWGSTTIIPPGDYLSSEGQIVAALWNWGTEPVTLSNSGFNYTVWTEEGRRLTVGIGEEGYITVQPTATPVSTPPEFDT